MHTRSKLRVKRLVLLSGFMILMSMKSKTSNDQDREINHPRHGLKTKQNEKGSKGESDYGYVYISICRLIDDWIAQTYAADEEQWHYISQLDDEIRYLEYNAKAGNSFSNLIKDLADALNERIAYIRHEFGCEIRHKDLIYEARLTEETKQDIMFKPLLPMSFCYNVSETTAHMTVKAAKMLMNKYNTQTVF